MHKRNNKQGGEKGARELIFLVARSTTRAGTVHALEKMQSETTLPNVGMCTSFRRVVRVLIWFLYSSSRWLAYVQSLIIINIISLARYVRFSVEINFRDYWRRKYFSNFANQAQKRHRNFLSNRIFQRHERELIGSSRESQRKMRIARGGIMCKVP